MNIEEMIAWCEREKKETLLDCRRELFDKAIAKLKEDPDASRTPQATDTD